MVYQLPHTKHEYAPSTPPPRVAFVLCPYPTLFRDRRYRLCSVFLVFPQGAVWWLIVTTVTVIFWILRTIVSVVMTVIPLIGLCAIGAAVFYYPTNLYDVLAITLGLDATEEGSWEDTDRGPVIA